MKRFCAGLSLAALAFCHNAVADLEIYKDYELGQGVSDITTVMVDANMFDVYLEGLRDTWVAANEVAKELGHIESYAIYASELPQSGDFNLVLVVRFASGADLEPSRAKHEAFMKAWGEANRDRNREIAQSYPEVREITGQYRLREVQMK